MAPFSMTLRSLQNLARDTTKKLQGPHPGNPFESSTGEHMELQGLYDWEQALLQTNCSPTGKLIPCTEVFYGFTKKYTKLTAPCTP